MTRFVQVIRQHRNSLNPLRLLRRQVRDEERAAEESTVESETPAVDEAAPATPQGEPAALAPRIPAQPLAPQAGVAPAEAPRPRPVPAWATEKTRLLNPLIKE